MFVLCVAPSWAAAGQNGDHGGVVLLPFRSAPPGATAVGAEAPDPVVPFLEKAMESGAQEAIRTRVLDSSLSIVDADEASVRLARATYDPDAEERRKKVRTLLDDAYGEYFALDLATARRNLSVAEDAMGRSSQTAEDLAILSDIKLLEGIIALSSDPASAGEDFDLVLRLAPDRTLDSRKFPPYAVSALRAAKDRFDLLPTTQVNVESDPPEARIFVDGVPRGETPRTIDRIATGDHFYRLEKARMQPVIGRIRLEGGTVSTIPVHLEPARFLDLQAEVASSLHDAAASPGAVLARLFSADRVVLATIAPEGPRRYTIAMWWADEQGRCSWPLRRTLSGEPVALSMGISALTREVLAAKPSDSREPAIDATALARDVALLAAGSITAPLKPPPKIWYKKPSTMAWAGGGALLGLLIIAAYYGGQPGQVDYDVTVKPAQ